MMNNIISIDLDKLCEYCSTEKEVIAAQVPTPCTLTELAVKSEGIRFTYGSYDYLLRNREEVEHFKENHLYKEDNLEDGIYEGTYIDTTFLYYVKNGIAYQDKKMNLKVEISDLTNPRKIADL